jgi:integrase
MRSIKERRATFERYVFSPLGNRPIADLKRSEIVKVLDGLPGDRTHDVVLMALNVVFTWHALRDENFVNLLPKGLARGTPDRERTLTDPELKAVWRACGEIGWYGTYVRLLLLTACRKSEIEDATRAEFNANGTELLIPASRYKTGKDHLVPLNKAAQGIIATIPVAGDRLFLNGVVKFGYRPHDKLKAVSGVEEFTLHDLRRTARTLMSRAGVPADHAERCLGHVIGGVRGIYDHHDYAEEKREAFEKLASEIKRIVS